MNVPTLNLVSDNYKESGSSETLDAQFAGQLLLYSASTKDSTGTGQDRLTVSSLP